MMHHLFMAFMLCAVFGLSITGFVLLWRAETQMLDAEETAPVCMKEAA